MSLLLGNKLGITREQLHSMILLTEKQLKGFDSILQNNDSYDELRTLLKNTTNKETKKDLKKEIDYYKQVVLPLRRKEREHIVKSLSLLKQMYKDLDNLKQMNKLSKKYLAHLETMHEFKKWLFDNNYQIWS
jgi:DNA mismatch repair ATPase MutS